MYHFIVPITNVDYYNTNSSYVMSGPMFTWETVDDLEKRYNLLQSMRDMELESEDSLNKTLKDLFNFMVYWDLRIRYSDEMMTLHHFIFDTQLNMNELGAFVSSELKQDQFKESVMQERAKHK